jgi:alpha-tubulin suppressor-like RCC1 family protein
MIHSFRTKISLFVLLIWLCLSNAETTYAAGANFYSVITESGEVDQRQPMLLPELTDVKQISISTVVTLVLKNNGDVYGAGESSSGLLGPLENSQKEKYPTLKKLDIKEVVELSAGTGHGLFVSKDHKLFTVGLNAHGQLGDGTNIDKSIPGVVSLENVTKVSAGSTHSLVLNQKNELYSFGENRYGALGIFSTTNRNIIFQ